MVRRALRSTSLRKVYKKTPGGKTVVHYRAEKPSRAKCAKTGQVLPGIKTASATQMKHMRKTDKRPERPYGGVLSSAAMREKMKEKARSMRFD